MSNYVLGNIRLTTFALLSGVAGLALAWLMFRPNRKDSTYQKCIRDGIHSNETDRTSVGDVFYDVSGLCTVFHGSGTSSSVS